MAEESLAEWWKRIWWNSEEVSCEMVEKGMVEWRKRVWQNGGGLVSPYTCLLPKLLRNVGGFGEKL